MKLGEIKVATLKLLFVGYENDINVGDLDELSLDENYKSYLFGMNDSINRAFSSIEEKGVLPSKSYTINKADGEVDGQFIRFDLKELLHTISAKFSFVCAGEYLLGFISYNFTFIPSFEIFNSNLLNFVFVCLFPMIFNISK